jgi:hypothetical protein
VNNINIQQHLDVCDRNEGFGYIKVHWYEHIQYVELGKFPIVMNYRSNGIKNVEKSRRFWEDSPLFASHFKVDDDDHHHHPHIHINNVTTELVNFSVIRIYGY